MTAQQLMTAPGQPVVIGLGAAGFDRGRARWALVVVWLSGVAYGFIGGSLPSRSPMLILAYLACLAAALLLTTRRPAPLTVAQAGALGVCAVFSSAVSLQFEAADSWLLQFPSYLVAMLIPRGNPVLGGVPGAAIVALVIGWGIGAGQPPDQLVGMLADPVAALFVGYVWLLALRYFVGRERAARDAAADARASEAAALAASELAASELAEIEAVVAPVLDDLAAGRAFDEAFHADVAVAEAVVRDRIRVPQLRHPRLEAALAGARRRGVRVLLVGEPSGTTGLDDATAGTLTGLVDSVAAGAVTIRSAPGRPLTVVLDRGGEVDRVELPAS